MIAEPSPLEDLLAELRRRGVTLSADGERLVVSAPKGTIDAAMAARLTQAKRELVTRLRHGDATAAIERVPRAAAMPLGFVQQRMWLHNQIEPDTVLYNLPAAWRLTGALDANALERALGRIVARHEVLRCRVATESGEPSQSFADDRGVRLEREDLSRLDFETRQHRLADRLAALRDQRIDLAATDPFRVRLFRCSESEHVLFFMPHHVVWDGWSFDIFLRDLNEFYRAEVSGCEPHLPDLPIQYVDYALWHRDWMLGGPVRTQTQHWLDVLADPPEPLAVPGDHARPRLFSHRGDWEEFWLSATTIERVSRLAANHRATSFMLLLAVWFAFLHRVSGQRDLIVGAPVQARQAPEVADLIGCFVNTLCLRQRIDPDMRFCDLLEEVRGACIDAYEHQDAPVEMLVDRLVRQRDPSRTPLFQAMFSHQQVSRRPKCLGDLEVSQVHINPAAAPTDLMLAIMEGSAGARGVLHYSSDLFAPGTVRRFRERFETLLESALLRPECRIGDLDWIPADELELLVSVWNETDMAYPRDVSVSTHLRSGAVAGMVAVRWREAVWTSERLWGRVHQLARELRSIGVGRGALVGLCLDRGVDMMIAQLAILESGAAYVPLDPAYPRERLAYMAEDARLALLVTDASHAQVVAWPRERSIWLDDDSARIRAHPQEVPAPDMGRDARPDDAAYVIYTSGSTGKPKGVVVPHRAVVNFLVSMAREPGLRIGDRLVAVTTLSFDIAVLELLLPLSVGAEVVLADRDQALDATALRALLESSGATMMQATPSTWRMLIEVGWQGSSHFKALIGGEALPSDLAEALLARTGELWNMYGPTETTVWSTCARVTGIGAGISIGKPIGNTMVHILDPRDRLCPIGVPGEICIGGDGVTTGYLHRPELTGERFIDDPVAGHGRIYRTGDRGRWRPDGSLEHLGRLDFQVKVRGHRIELGEIEAGLVSHPEVQRCVVTVREDTPGDARLVAYVVARGSFPGGATLREHVRRFLPEYMVPQHVVSIDAVPLLPNGKVDRSALPPPVVEPTRASVGLTTPLTPQEHAVAEIWKSVLDLAHVSATDNFFDLGGHSLLAIQVSTRMQRELGIGVPVRRLIFETLGQIAAASRWEAVANEPRLQPKLGLIGRLKRALRPGTGSGAAT